MRKMPMSKNPTISIRAVSVGRWNVADVTAYVAAIVLAGAALGSASAAWW